MEYYLAMKNNELLVCVTIWMNLKTLYCERNQSQKDHVFYDSIYIKCPK